MEEVFSRFPHLSEDIFGALDYKSLENCKLVGKSWRNYMYNPKLLQIRRVKMVKETLDEFCQIDTNRANMDFPKNFDSQTKSAIMNWAETGDFFNVNKLIIETYLLYSKYLS